MKDKVLENLTKEEIDKKREQNFETYKRLYVSDNLFKILIKMESPIAKELISMKDKNVKFDISFLDLPKNDKDYGKVTFFLTTKLKKLEDLNVVNIDKDINRYNSELWTSNRREQPTKIGKIVIKIFGNKYTNKQIEDFSNEFKGLNESSNSKMRVVYGKEIQKWYLEENYAERKSTLGGSCMRYPEKNKYMELYADNPPEDLEGAKYKRSYVGMLILLDDNNKLLARAIVWFDSIKPMPDRVFMDRVYYTSDHYINIFTDYAKKHNWIYKDQQTYSNNTYVDPLDNKKHSLSITFRLKNKKYNHYPYLDTLTYYSPETGRISTVDNKNKKFKTLTLRRQDGRADTIR